MSVDEYDRWGKYACSYIISLHHVHSCYEHMHRARSVRKSYNYSEVFLSQVGEKVIWLFQSALVDYVATCWPRPYRYNIVRCLRRGTMQLHTLLGMEAVDMHMHCIALFEVYLYWSFMLAWSGYEEHYFYLYEKYYFIHIGILFIYCISSSIHVYVNFSG
jgi:hypothetical protein